MRQTAGDWDASAAKIFFFVCVGGTSSPGAFDQIPESYNDALFPINDINDASFVASNNVLIDSGAFSVASAAAKDSHLPAGKIFGMPLREVPGGEQALRFYEKTVTEYKDRCWGYIEFDIGDHASKTKRREAQEAQGICPIPVFSVRNDPVEYFTDLLVQYDRVAIGSIARGMLRADKIRALAAVEGVYRESGSGAWVHLLGCSPSPATAWAHSMDASNWAAGGIFGQEQYERHLGLERLPIHPSFSDAPLIAGNEHRADWCRERRRHVFNACATREGIRALQAFDHRHDCDQCIKNT